MFILPGSYFVHNQRMAELNNISVLTTRPRFKSHCDRFVKEIILIIQPKGDNPACGNVGLWLKKISWVDCVDETIRKPSIGVLPRLNRNLGFSVLSWKLKELKEFKTMNSRKGSVRDGNGLRIILSKKILCSWTLDRLKQYFHLFISFKTHCGLYYNHVKRITGISSVGIYNIKKVSALKASVMMSCDLVQAQP